MRRLGFEYQAIRAHTRVAISTANGIYQRAVQNATALARMELQTAAAAATTTATAQASVEQGLEIRAPAGANSLMNSLENGLRGLTMTSLPGLSEEEAEEEESGPGLSE